MIILSSELPSFIEKASAESNTSGYDPEYFRAVSGIVPRNSGIQNLYPNYLALKLQASNQHWKIRSDCKEMAKSIRMGFASISSEGGDMVKTFQTMRQEQRMSVQNSGPKADGWDKILYGDKKFENQGGNDF